jgi:predicted ATPase
LGARQLTPLVGGDDEMAMLLRRWERARQGDVQLVMIVGEPGLGKSRLIEEFHVRLSDTPHTWVEWSCSQLFAERGALAPLYIVATTRPEFRPAWGMRSHHGTISLAPLDRAQVRDMVAELSARHALPRLGS